MKTVLLAVFLSVLASGIVAVSFSSMLAPEDATHTTPDAGGAAHGRALEQRVQELSEQLARLQARDSAPSIGPEVSETTRSEVPAARSETPPPCDRHCDLLQQQIAQLARRIEAIENHLRFGGTTPLAEEPRKNKRAWGPEQVTGAPDTPGGGDRSTAWASRTEDGEDEWLLLSYDHDIDATGVKVHETYNPGALTKVSVFDGASEIVVWQGVDPTSREQPEGVSHITFPGTYRTKQVKLYFDSRGVRGWNEIDAVALIEASGHSNWASEASASSTYAERQADVTSWKSGANGEFQTSIQFDSSVLQLFNAKSANDK